MGEGAYLSSLLLNAEVLERDMLRKHAFMKVTNGTRGRLRPPPGRHHPGACALC